MKLGNFKFFFLLLILTNTFFVLAEDKIESVPLINLEELSPTFEEDKTELEKIEDKNITLNNLFAVNEVVEKPDKPKSEFGILPLYYFKSDVFSSLKKIKPGKGKEFQLTDAIQNMIKEKQKVLAITLNKNEEEVDVGTVESYRNAQEVTFRKA